MEITRKKLLELGGSGLLSVLAGGFVARTGLAASEPAKPLAQAEADAIHKREVERAILEAGEDPREVRAEVERRSERLRPERWAANTN